MALHALTGELTYLLQEIATAGLFLGSESAFPGQRNGIPWSQWVLTPS